jgi:hypothetical protein
MRHSALKRRPTHHNTNRLPHPGQAARSARKRELQRARQVRVAEEAKRFGISAFEYEDRQWREVQALRSRAAQQQLNAVHMQRFPSTRLRHSWDFF